MENREINIRRNIVERALMGIKDYVKNNSKIIIYGLAAFLIIAVLAIGLIIYTDRRETAELIKLEQILDAYRNSQTTGEENRIQALENTVKGINTLIDRSFFGYSHNNGNYIIGGLYYNERKHDKARNYYLKFVKGSPKSVFAPLALQQAARSCEYMNDNKGAFEIYKRLEKEYATSPVADQIYYDLGRMYQIEGDLFKSRDSFNKVIISFPRSDFAQKSRERLIMLGLSPKKA